MVSGDTDKTRISVIGTWQDVLEAQRKVKKFEAKGLHLRVEQLTDEQVMENHRVPIIASWFKSQFTPRLAAAVRRTPKVDHFAIEVLGPKVYTPRAPKCFIIQQGEDGSLTPSRPLSREHAEIALKAGRGVLSYLCEVKSTYDTRGPR